MFDEENKRMPLKPDINLHYENIIVRLKLGNELVENDRIFQCGTVTCKFTTDSREFVDEPILPRLPRYPLQQSAYNQGWLLCLSYIVYRIVIFIDVVMHLVLNILHVKY
ncbi:uncharacterized protein OCT59_029523 [Rhizophagus irregularis]|uniref:uncharacterized protein n=1 Tax=Rhizophagus irregularis TaxID=588596 RepID=UPI0033338872|nr:hypothetical protein OCT59_029523 [Rhizophagus irregularis]